MFFLYYHSKRDVRDPKQVHEPDLNPLNECSFLYPTVAIFCSFSRYVLCRRRKQIVPLLFCLLQIRLETALPILENQARRLDLLDWFVRDIFGCLLSSTLSVLGNLFVTSRCAEAPSCEQMFLCWICPIVANWGNYPENIVF